MRYSERERRIRERYTEIDRQIERKGEDKKGKTIRENFSIN